MGDLRSFGGFESVIFGMYMRVQVCFGALKPAPLLKRRAILKIRRDFEGKVRYFE